MGRNRQNRETLARLVEESQNGNREAFEELYRRTAQAQFYLMAHRVGYEAANDLLQELYLIAWRNIRKIRPFAVLGYLGSVGRNLCRRHVEHAAAAQRSVPLDVDALEASGSDDEAAAALHDTNADPAHLVTAADEHVRLARALREELTDFERTCVVMRYYQGAKIDEIAEAVDSSRNTVKRTLSRALMTLRTKMSLAPWGALGLSGALPQVVEKRMAAGARALERPSGRWSLATGAVGLAAVGVTAGAIAFAMLAPMPPASPAGDVEPVTIEEARVPASQTAGTDTEPPVLKSVTVEGNTTVLRLLDASGVRDVRCTSSDGTVHRAVSHEADPGNSSSSLWRFDLSTGTYEAWAVDVSGNEATGEIAVEIYPDEPPPYEP